jgi:parallel beta-helix repeat protein
MLLAGPVLLPAGLTGAAAGGRPMVVRDRGGARINVHDHGARGDGHSDDTDALQQAIDALPAAGGTVLVPAGTYLVDPVRSVRLRNRMLLQLADGASLVAKPNAAEKAYVLLAFCVSDVEIAGGRILGDRDGHLGSSGEWGHGIQLRGASRVTIRDINVSRCWGDGICIGGAKLNGDRRQILPSTDIVLSGVHCVGNRRQGLTIGRSRRVQVFDSEFSDTHGTAPQAGIDVEPDPGDFAIDVRIENCVIRGNRGPGIQLYRHVSAAVVSGCTIEGNGGNGILAIGADGGELARNQISDNGLDGIGIRHGTRNFLIHGNTVRGKVGGRKKAVALGDDVEAIRILPDNVFK